MGLSKWVGKLLLYRPRPDGGTTIIHPIIISLDAVVLYEITAAHRGDAHRPANHAKLVSSL